MCSWVQVPWFHPYLLPHIQHIHRAVTYSPSNWVYLVPTSFISRFCHIITHEHTHTHTHAHTRLASSPSNCMTRWLTSLGISAENVSSYVTIFHWEGVTEQALRLLSLEDLQSIGIEKFGHRALIHNTLEQGQSCIISNYILVQRVSGEGGGHRNFPLPEI